MSKHTPEPWETVNDNEPVIIGDNGYEIAMIPEEDDDRYGLPKANAVRIVACVNACAGITDNELSHGPVTPQHRHSYVVNEREELLAVLRDLCEWDSLLGGRNAPCWHKARQKVSS